MNFKPGSVLMRTKFTVALLGALLASACTGGGAADNGAASEQPPIDDVASVRQSIETGHQQIASAFKAGDVAAAAAVYAPDALVMGPNEPVMRGAAIAEGLKGMFQQVSFPSITLTTSDVTVSGDYAFEHGTFDWTVQPKAPGAPAVPDKGKYLTVWQKQADGSWKLYRDIWNTDTPAQH
jgi:uncharacterized protein (TIGR02246 family)